MQQDVSIQHPDDNCLTDLTCAFGFASRFKIIYVDGDFQPTNRTTTHTGKDFSIAKW